MYLQHKQKLPLWTSFKLNDAVLPPGDIWKAETKFVDVMLVAAVIGADIVVIPEVSVRPPAAPNLNIRYDIWYKMQCISMPDVALSMCNQ